MKVVVVGTGYVGLVTGTCLADMGHDVTCVDIDQAKIEGLNKMVMPIYEVGLRELVRRNSEAGRLTFTTELGTCVPGADVVFIAVGTPPDEDGSADKRYVLNAAQGVAECMDGYLVVVVKSTVPVGTCAKVADRVSDTLTERDCDAEFDVVSNPEFLKEGKAIDDFMRPDRIVVGVDSERAQGVMQKLYHDFTRNAHPLVFMGVNSSEMTKYAANCMLATRISLMNELANICDVVGADIMEVRQGIGTDSRIGMSFLYAGIGYGGSCFPKDVKAMARVGLETECGVNLLDGTERVNRAQKLVMANRVLTRFGGDLKGRTIAIWGLAFKPNTDDMREAPAMTIIKRLLDEGADIRAFDPVAMDRARLLLDGFPGVTFVADKYAALTGADAVILVTEWGEFRTIDFARLRREMRSPIFFDGRNQFEPAEMAVEDIEYYGIGRGRRPT